MDPTDTATNQLPPQTEIGDYRVIRCFASGGMGDLYEVVNPMLREFFAMKVLRSDSDDSSRSEESRALFFNEARTTVRLRHSNIVTLHTMGVEPNSGNLYLVMDYVGVSPQRRKEILTGSGAWFRMGTGTDSGSGKTPEIRVSLSLEEVLATRGPIPENVLRLLAIDIANALHHAHSFEAGVIHCDLKPSNILLRNDGHAVVTDFGIARAQRRMDAEGSDRSSTTLYGTPEYMAPEQYRADGNITPQTDIYAFGVTVCRLLTGSFPLGIWDRPSELGLDAAWDELILRCIRRNPEDRWPSMAHIVRFLMDMPNYKARLRRKRNTLRILFAGLGLTVLILLGLTAAVILKQNAAPKGPPPTPDAFMDNSLGRAELNPEYSGPVVYGAEAPACPPMPATMKHVSRLCLSAGIRSLPPGFFDAFPRLESITCAPGNPVFFAYGGILYSREQPDIPYAVPPRLFGKIKLPRSVQTFIYPWDDAKTTPTRLTSEKYGAYGQSLSIRATHAIHWQLRK